MYNKLKEEIIGLYESGKVEMRARGIVKEFLSTGNLGVTTENGYTLLMMAAVNNNVKLADLLIEAGVCVDERDDFCYTPLIYAAHFGRCDMVKFLVSKGANVNLKNNNNCTALDVARYYCRTEVVELLEKDADFINEEFSRLLKL